jgi:hypothetical protein
MADEKVVVGKMPAPFVVEFGDDSCRQITLDAVRLTLRGAWSMATLAGRPGGCRTGEKMMGSPEVPGIRCAVNPRDGKAIFFDPLEDDKQLLDKINRWASGVQAVKVADGYTAWPKQEFELDEDQLKTLCIELYRKCNGGGFGVKGTHVCAKVVKGKLPTEEEIAAMPGDEMIEQWNEGRHPRYRKDVKAWNDRLERFAAV